MQYTFSAFLFFLLTSYNRHLLQFNSIAQIQLNAILYYACGILSCGLSPAITSLNSMQFQNDLTNCTY